MSPAEISVSGAGGYPRTSCARERGTVCRRGPNRRNGKPGQKSELAIIPAEAAVDHLWGNLIAALLFTTDDAMMLAGN
jgi:hypothetical protein